MFSKDSLQQLKDKIDLPDLIGSVVPLKRVGSSYKGCCPFHNEKTPSFQVQKGATHFHCFGCGAHGDAFSFLMQYHGYSFAESAQCLADRYHINLEKSHGAEDENRKRLLEALDQAQRFLVWSLWNHPEANHAREYLHERGLSEPFCKRFGLGYCPSQRTLLKEYLNSLRFKDHELEQAGLITAGPKRYDFFSSRITFPITNYRGQVIAFSARKFLESTFGGKYINSPETPLFKKSRTLFALPWVRSRLIKEKKAILVEGQLDTLRLIDVGLNIATAALGTALGPDHVIELKKLGVQSVYVMFDGDAAGREAACKVGHLLMKEAIEVQVVQMGEDEDPDSLLSYDNGLEMIGKRLSQAIGYIDFLVSHRSQGKDMRSPAVKTALTHQLKEQIEQWQQPVLVYEGLKSLARALCVPEALLIGSTKPPSQLSSQSLARHPLPIQSEKQPLEPLEADLIRWLLTMAASCPSLMTYCQKYLKASYFRHPHLRKLYELFEQGCAMQPALDFTAAITQLDDELAQIAAQLAHKRLDRQHFKASIEHLVKGMVHRAYMETAESLRLEIQGGKLSDEQAIEKAQQYAQLRKDIPVPESFLQNES